MHSGQQCPAEVWSNNGRSPAFFLRGRFQSYWLQVYQPRKRLDPKIIPLAALPPVGRTVVASRLEVVAVSRMAGCAPEPSPKGR